MSLPLDARFGFDAEPDELDGREYMLLMGALRMSLMYSRGLAERNKDPEAAERNRVNELEMRLLMEKIDAARKGTRGLTIKPLRQRSKANDPRLDMRPRGVAA